MRIRIAEYGEALGLRSRAKDLRARIETLIGKDTESSVIIDLADVTVFSISFGDELFAELVRRAQAGQYGVHRWVAFAGADEFAVEQLDQVLKNAHLAALVKTSKGGVVLVGEIEPKVKKAFDLIETLGEATTGQLKTRLRTNSIQAVNNLVSKLVSARVVDREQVGRGSGRPYIYRARTEELVGAGGR